MRKSITIHEAPQWVKELKGELHKAALKGLLSAALRTVQHITSEVIPQEAIPPVDQGAFRAAWRARKTDGGAEIVNSMPYAMIIEYGARGANVKIGRVMIDALTEWVKRKGLAGRRGKGGGDFEARARGIAFAIAKTMQKKGIFNGGKGLRILEKASKRVPDFIQEEVRREIEKL